MSTSYIHAHECVLQECGVSLLLFLEAVAKHRSAEASISKLKFNRTSKRRVVYLLEADAYTKPLRFMYV
jgi:hypothetical protein